MSTSKVGWNFNNSYIQLPNLFYTNMDPLPVKNPKVVILNKELAYFLGLEPKKLEGDYGSMVLSGSLIPEGADPIAQAYAGHQFGHFTKLGDGRAILLGEQVNDSGERFDIQLKGSGRTPYSRGGDGRATLGPMLREYIISEGMYGLGIPTTRSLAVTTTGEAVLRQGMEHGAILTRIAESHIRVGTFQYAKYFGDDDIVKTLADYTIKRHYPGVMEENNPYLGLFKAILDKQARLISKWMLVGFIHGVMNTDNMSICGETIDYGPCAFMDTYDPSTVFSSIDHGGRYAYGNQPDMGAWNLARLADSLLPLIDKDIDKAIAIAQDELSTYKVKYYKYWAEGMGKKLGIFNIKPDDGILFKELLRIMQINKSDYTNTFRDLTIGKLDNNELISTKEFKGWYDEWNNRLGEQKETDEEAYTLMKKNNPSVIPRNYLVEKALSDATSMGDFSTMTKLISALRDPYAYSIEQEKYAKTPPKCDTPYRTFCGT